MSDLLLNIHVTKNKQHWGRFACSISSQYERWAFTGYISHLFVNKVTLHKSLNHKMLKKKNQKTNKININICISVMQEFGFSAICCLHTDLTHQLINISLKQRWGRLLLGVWERLEMFIKIQTTVCFGVCQSLPGKMAKGNLQKWSPRGRWSCGGVACDTLGEPCRRTGKDWSFG